MSTVTEDKIKEKRERIMAAAKGSKGEPSVTEANYGIEMKAALNYYNAFEDYKTKRDWVRKYTLKHGMTREYEIVMSDAKDYHFTQIGVLMRLKERGQFVSDHHWKMILAKFDKIQEIEADRKLMDDEFEERKGSTPTVDKTQILVDQCMDRINGEIDHFIMNKSTTKFSLKPFFDSNNITTAARKIVSDILQKISRELSTVNYDDSEDQMAEGYSNFSKRELRGYKDLIDGMINDCSVSKKPRKAKMVKQKPAAVLVNRIKYKASASVGAINLKSKSPESIIGAKELWLYNVENRIVWMFKSSTGLDVKGSSIVGYDEERSCGKRMRNPEKFLSGVRAKASMTEAFNNIESKSFPINSRTNENLIILEIF